MDAAIELVPRTTIPGSSRSSSKALLATELEQVPVEFHGGPQTYASNETSLLPVDTGFGAWSFLVGAFFIETLVWGFPNAFGVFLAAYLDDDTVSSQKHASSLLPLIGTLSSGLIYASGPFLNPLMSRFPRYRRATMYSGVLICFCSLLGASYANEVTTLLALQGVLYGIGGSLLYSPCLSYVAEWFVRRRGTATGVIFAGTATGGLLLPLILPPLITKFGASKTLRYLAIAKLVLLLPTLPFIRPRLPEARVHGPSARSRGDKSWLKETTFWILLFANTLQGIAYFVPVVWLPTFASSLNISATDSSLALALLNGASLFGRIAMGMLSDKINPWLLAVCTLSCASIATFVLWGVLSYSLAGILAYGVVYGGIASSWSSLYTGFVRPIAKDDPNLATSIFGFLMLSRGLGNVLSTPISTALRNIHSEGAMSHPSIKSGFKVGGGQYEGMIVFVGTAFAGAAIIVSLGWGVEKWNTSRRS